MLLSTILKDPTASLLHMERYVNRGSPSGFSQLYTPSSKYAPIEGDALYELPLYEFDQNVVLKFGDSSARIAKAVLGEKDIIYFPLHPDMQEKLVKELLIREFDPSLVAKTVLVVPTANGRTVYCGSYQPPLYFKLHYDGILGRVDRKLSIKKTVASTEISEEVVRFLSNKSVPINFAILPEPFAIVKPCASKQGTEEVGCIVRETVPFPPIKASALIPCFSLFSQDTHNHHHPLLLIQLLTEYNRPWEILRDKIIEPLLRCYCAFVFELGLIPELNAQNVLVAIDEQSQISGLVIRDLQGFEKDLSIRRSLNLSCHFQSAPYKCIDRDLDEHYYFIRHSFSYDFKLGEYILDELLNVFAQSLHMRADPLREEIKHLFHKISTGKDTDHFYPRDTWFVHDKILLTNERPYLKLKNPKYRFS